MASPVRASDRGGVPAWYPPVKRGLDVVLAGAALLVLAPVMLAVAALVRLRLGSPVLFRQQRPGLHGSPFLLYKFRSMRDLTDAAGRPLSDSQRLTRFGRALRASSLDELPELINVLRGEMSLVGPRPLLMEYLPLYNSEQRRRHAVRPGLTGWAQVHGRNALDWPDRLRLDVWYVDHYSLSLDLRILWLSVWAVLRRDGISRPGQDTMPKFRGDSQIGGRTPGNQHL